MCVCVGGGTIEGASPLLKYRNPPKIIEHFLKQPLRFNQSSTYGGFVAIKTRVVTHPGASNAE